MQFKKIFEVAEVCIAMFPHAHGLPAFQKRFGKEPGAPFHVRSLTSSKPRVFTRVGTLRFVYDGERLSPTDTPAEARSPLLPFLMALTRFS